MNNRILLTLLLSIGLTACSTTDLESTNSADDTAQTAESDPAVEEQNKGVVGEVAEETAESNKAAEPVVKPVPTPVEPPKPLPRKTKQGQLILGEVEWVFVPGLNQSFEAKVDTGATISSVSATDIIAFERDGESWVKFKIEHNGVSSEEISLPVLRWVTIKQANNTKGEKRPVIAAWIQVGDFKDKANFTLTDRQHLSYPMLIGQEFFRDIAIVDVSRQFVQKKIKGKE